MDKAYFCSMLKDNIYRKKRLIRSLLGVAALVATLYSCASMGRPDGDLLMKLHPASSAVRRQQEP